MKKTAILLLLSLLALTLFGCGLFEAPEPPRQARSYYEYFDTVTTVFSYKGDSEEIFEANCEAVGELLGDYHKLFNIYYEYAGVNNLRTVNKNAGIAPVKVDARLIDFLVYAKEMYYLTEGRMNIAMGAVLSLWHDARTEADDDPEATPRIPSPDILSQAAEHISIESLVIDEAASTVYISDPEASIDVGAIGKGYATDRARDLLRSRGADAYMLNVGGNLSAIGTRINGKGWVAGVTNPDPAEEDFACRITLADVSCVTSGNYERFYTVGGVRYHHLIDPDTLMPAVYHSSVTVVCKDSSLGDTLSTALFCMTREDGERLVSSLDGVEVLWISADYKDSYHTDGFPIAK